MTIETKYDKGDKLMFIRDDKLIEFPVIDVQYDSGGVYYKFRTKKGMTLMDRDEYTVMAEYEVFTDINELKNYYLNES